MSGAIPKKLIISPKPDGYKGIESRVVDLLPANASGSSIFGPTGLNRIVFNIPSYEGCVLNCQKTFLKFSAKTTNDDSLLSNGLPLFERLVVKAGNGVVLEDIQSYDYLERIHEHIKDQNMKSVDGVMNGFYDTTNMPPTQITTLKTAINAQQHQGKKYIKKLLSGVVGAYNENYLPLHLMTGAGGFALTVELYLNQSNRCMKQHTTPANAAAAIALGYELSDVKLQMDLIHLPKEICNKFNDAVCGGSDIVMPFNTFRTHQFSIGSGQTKTNMFISEATHDLQRVWTIFTNPAIPNTNATVAEPIKFFGGGGNANTILNTYQFRYGTKFLPSQRCEAQGGVEALANALCSINSLSGTPYLATKYAVDTVYTKYEVDAFLLVQSFEYSEDSFKNGLNSTSSGAPIQLDLEFSSMPNAVLATSFVESGYSLVIKKGGQVSMVDGKVED
jgi:hypothetical protein